MRATIDAVIMRERRHAVNPTRILPRYLLLYCYILLDRVSLEDKRVNIYAGHVPAVRRRMERMKVSNGI